MTGITERLVEIGLRGRIAELEAESERLQAALDIAGSEIDLHVEQLRAALADEDALGALVAEYSEEINRLRAENARLQGIIQFMDVAKVHQGSLP